MRAAAMALALAGSLAGCAKPVPVEKAEYVGTWQGPQMTLPRARASPTSSTCALPDSSPAIRRRPVPLRCPATRLAV